MKSSSTTGSLNDTFLEGVAGDAAVDWDLVGDFFFFWGETSFGYRT
jgi:hypothetical protein